jgi:integrase
MSVYLRGSIYWTKFQFNGRSIRRSTGKAKKKEAEKYERDLRAQLEKDAEALQFDRPLSRTFGQAMAKWLESGAPQSMLSHARAVREHLENTDLNRVVPSAADMMQAMLAAKLSPQTINRRLAVVRRILNLAYRRWAWLKEPLGQRIELLSERGLERHIYLQQEQVTALLKAMGNPEAQRFILLASYTGLRKSEIRGLTQANWRKPSIVLGAMTKSGKPRAVPLVDDLHWIMDHLPFQISEWELRKDFEQAREAIGLPEVRMHDLRHTFASWLAADPNTPLTVIRDLLGHSSLAVTSRYSHLKTGALQDAILSLSGHKTGHTLLPSSADQTSVSD